MPHPADRIRVAIVVCTFHRPRGLTSVLESIARVARPEHVDLHVFVIDNAPRGGAREAVEHRLRRSPEALVWVHEPAPGISAARNRALECVLDHRPAFDFMATLDDDMHVDEAWLRELLKVARETAADAVMARVEFAYDGGRDWWVEAARALDAHAPGDRQSLSQGHTGNSLVRVECVRRAGLRFDEGFGLSGGEDTVFFDRMLQGGARLVYAEHAIAYECLTPERLRVRWWLMRWYRTGNTTGRVNLLAGRRSRVETFLDGVIRVVFGAAGTVAGLPLLLLRQRRPMRAVRMVFRGSGYVAAAFGARFREYDKRPRIE